MTRHMLKKFFALLLVLFMAIGQMGVYAANPSARTITIFRIDGDNVTLSRGDGRSTSPRANQRLSDGHVISTGANSSVFLQMDNDSILQMNANSQVAVSSSGNQLTLTVQSGAALMDAGAQGQSQTLETRVGNVGLTVRGTLFTIGAGNDGIVRVVMLTGEGEINGIPLPAGTLIMVWDGDDLADGQEMLSGHSFEIHTELVAEELDLFTLQVIFENSEYLLEAGVVTEALIEALPELIEQLVTEIEEAAAIAAEQEAEEEDDVVVHLPEQEPTPAPSPGPAPSEPEPEQPPPPPPSAYVTVNFNFTPAPDPVAGLISYAEVRDANWELIDSGDTVPRGSEIIIMIQQSGIGGIGPYQIDITDVTINGVSVPVNPGIFDHSLIVNPAGDTLDLDIVVSTAPAVFVGYATTGDGDGGVNFTDGVDGVRATAGTTITVEITPDTGSVLEGILVEGRIDGVMTPLSVSPAFDPAEHENGGTFTIDLPANIDPVSDWRDSQLIVTADFALDLVTVNFNFTPAPDPVDGLISIAQVRDENFELIDSGDSVPRGSEITIMIQQSGIGGMGPYQIDITAVTINGVSVPVNPGIFDHSLIVNPDGDTLNLDIVVSTAPAVFVDYETTGDGSGSVNFTEGVDGVRATAGTTITVEITPDIGSLIAGVTVTGRIGGIPTPLNFSPAFDPATHAEGITFTVDLPADIDPVSDWQDSQLVVTAEFEPDLVTVNFAFTPTPDPVDGLISIAQVRDENFELIDSGDSVPRGSEITIMIQQSGIGGMGPYQIDITAVTINGVPVDVNPGIFDHTLIVNPDGDTLDLDIVVSTAPAVFVDYETTGDGSGSVNFTEGVDGVRATAGTTITVEITPDIGSLIAGVNVTGRIDGIPTTLNFSPAFDPATHAEGITFTVDLPADIDPVSDWQDSQLIVTADFEPELVAVNFSPTEANIGVVNVISPGPSPSPSPAPISPGDQVPYGTELTVEVEVDPGFVLDSATANGEPLSLERVSGAFYRGTVTVNVSGALNLEFTAVQGVEILIDIIGGSGEVTVTAGDWEIDLWPETPECLFVRAGPIWILIISAFDYRIESILINGEPEINLNPSERTISYTAALPNVEIVVLFVPDV